MNGKFKRGVANLALLDVTPKMDLPAEERIGPSANSGGEDGSA